MWERLIDVLILKLLTLGTVQLFVTISYQTCAPRGCILRQLKQLQQ
jgi:hypothetical protein